MLARISLVTHTLFMHVLFKKLSNRYFELASETLATVKKKAKENVDGAINHDLFKLAGLFFSELLFSFFLSLHFCIE